MTTNTLEKPATRGIEIHDIDGKSTAILARNQYKLLEAITKADKQPTDWTGIESYEGKPNVYEVGKEIPGKAFPGLESGASTANSVKRILDEEKVLEIIRPGTTSSPAVIHLLVDAYQVKERKVAKAKTGTGRPVGRPPGSAKAKTAKTVKAKVGKVAITGSFDAKAFKAAMKMQKNLADIKKTYPVEYAMFIEPQLSKVAA